MNIEEALRKEHSKKQCLRIVDYIGSDSKKFAVLMKHFFSAEYRLAQRAAWPVSFCIHKHPQLIRPYFAKLINGLSNSTVHPAVVRNTLRIFEEMDVPVRFHARLLDTCFGFIASQDAPGAIKAYSLTILERLSKKYPDILQELITIIEDRWSIESPAFRSRAKKIKSKTS